MTWNEIVEANDAAAKAENEQRRCAICKRRAPWTLEEDQEYEQFHEDDSHLEFTTLNYPLNNDEHDCFVVKFWDFDNDPNLENTKAYRRGSDRQTWEDNLLCQTCTKVSIENGELTELPDVCGVCGGIHAEIRCQICNTHHRCAGGPTQGDDCAAQVFLAKNGGVYAAGHWGSSYCDMSLIKITGLDLVDSLVTKLASVRMMDPVCDNCLRSWVEAGAASFAGHHPDWDFPEHL